MFSGTESPRKMIVSDKRYFIHDFCLSFRYYNSQNSQKMSTKPKNENDTIVAHCKSSTREGEPLNHFLENLKCQFWLPHVIPLNVFEQNYVMRYIIWTHRLATIWTFSHSLTFFRQNGGKFHVILFVHTPISIYYWIHWCVRFHISNCCCVQPHIWIFYRHEKEPIFTRSWKMNSDQKTIQRESNQS